MRSSVRMTSSINDQIVKDKLNNTQNLPCHDFLAFQDLLLRSRKIDDNISNLINTTIPTDSFVCEKNDPSKQVGLSPVFSCVLVNFRTLLQSLNSFQIFELFAYQQLHSLNPVLSPSPLTNDSTKLFSVQKSLGAAAEDLRPA